MPRPTNLGETRLTKRRRAEDPMAAFDRLPAHLRTWLRDAKLPWSPRSAHQIWTKSSQAGLSPEDILAKLDRTEARMLARDSHHT